MDKRENYSKGDAVFHYDREERIKHLSPGARQFKRVGILKSNRSVLFMMINIILVAVLAFVVVPILRTRQKQARFDGCVFVLKGFVYEDRALLSLVVKANEDRPASSSAIFEADISLEKSGNAVTVTDILPVKKGQSIVARAELSLKAGTDTAMARVKIKDTVLNLTAAIEPEK